MKLWLGLRPPCSRFNNWLLVYFNGDPPTSRPPPPPERRGGERRSHSLPPFLLPWPRPGPARPSGSAPLGAGSASETSRVPAAARSAEGTKAAAAASPFAREKMARRHLPGPGSPRLPRRAALSRLPFTPLRRRRPEPLPRGCSARAHPQGQKGKGREPPPAPIPPPPGSTFRAPPGWGRGLALRCCERRGPRAADIFCCRRKSQSFGAAGAAG